MSELGLATPAAPRRVDVKAMRDRVGMNVHEFAEALNVNTRTVRRWEREGISPSPMARAQMRSLLQRTRSEREQARAAGGADMPSDAQRELRDAMTGDSHRSSSAPAPSSSLPRRRLPTL